MYLWYGSFVQGESLNFVFVVWQFCTRWIFELCIFGVAVLYKVNLWTLYLWCGSIVQGESLNFVFVVWQYCTRGTLNFVLLIKLLCKMFVIL